MTWLLITISFYFIFSIVSLVDKYLLGGRIPSPKVYTFYVGALGVLVLFLLPFVGFEIPVFPQIVLALFAGAIYIFALFWFFKGLQLFEASRIVPAIGGLVPLFTLGLTCLFSWGKETLSFLDIIALLLLVFGSILIASERAREISWGSLKLSILVAFLFSLSFVLTKYVYLAQPFWNGFIWKSIGGFLMATCFFIFFPEIKKEIFKNRTSEGSEGKEEGKTLFFRREKFPKKTTAIFITNQAAGAGANILQNWAIALAPLAYVAIINALQGVQYVFLLIFTIFLSLKLPQIVKEEISKGILFQKIVAILFIGLGLVILAF